MIETKTDQIYQLGTLVGRKQALAALAGRCSAAGAECLRRIREGKEYRTLGLSWAEFCKQRVGVTRITADKIIQRLEEFGPQYFILAQTTGIRPEEYRRIQGAVRGQNLLHAGEEIPIDADHAPRLNAAIEALRREKTPALEGPPVSEAPAVCDDAAVAKTRAEVARDLRRAAGHMRSALECYKRLASRRIESHMRAALVAELRSFAGSLQDLHDDTRIR